jgi:hypothetical protein
MVQRYSLAALLFLAFAWSAPATAQYPGTFRLGNDPYRFVEDAPGHAYTRDTPSYRAYFRAPRTGDDQIGPPPPPDEVSRLSDQYGHHLKMAYKHDVPEYNRRYTHFRSVMDEWDKSPKGVEQQVQVTQYLKTSLKYSVPGSGSFMPPMQRVNPIDQDSDSTRSPGVLDPFRDDPVQAAPM